MRADEQFFGFFVRASDRDPSSYDREQSLKAINGIRNNFPHLMPTFVNDPNDVGRALRRLGQPFDILRPASKTPVLAWPKEIDEPLRRCLAKFCIALFYMHTRQYASPGAHISVMWTLPGDLNAEKALNEAASLIRYYAKGARSNVDLGNQLHYRWDWSGKGSGRDEIFVAVGMFGQGVGFFLSIINQQALDQLPPEERNDYTQIVEFGFGRNNDTP